MLRGRGRWLPVCAAAVGSWKRQATVPACRRSAVSARGAVCGGKSENAEPSFLTRRPRPFPATGPKDGASGRGGLPSSAPRVSGQRRRPPPPSWARRASWTMLTATLCCLAGFPAPLGLSAECFLSQAWRQAVLVRVPRTPLRPRPPTHAPSPSSCRAHWPPPFPSSPTQHPGHRGHSQHCQDWEFMDSDYLFIKACSKWVKRGPVCLSSHTWGRFASQIQLIRMEDH